MATTCNTEPETITVYMVWKDSMPKRREVIRGTKTKIYCQGTVCRRRVLAALRTVILGLTKARNEAKPLKYPEKKLYFVTI